MNSLKASEHEVRAERVEINGECLVVSLSDGRSITVPLSWYPRLQEASSSERGQFELIGAGVGIHWPLLDEDLSVEGLLQGRGSMESGTSFQRWQASRR
jgi:hypothetical protein